MLFKTDYNYIDMGGAFRPTLATAINDPFHITSNAPWEALDKFSRWVLDLSYTFAGDIKLRSVSGCYLRIAWIVAKFDADGTDLLPFYIRRGSYLEEEIYSERGQFTIGRYRLDHPDRGTLLSARQCNHPGQRRTTTAK